MRETKPPKKIIREKQQLEQRQQEILQLKNKFKSKRELTQADINELVLIMARQQGLI